ncbi:pH regulation protein F [Nanohaloarchaea archaeon]|jgi:multicomponent Na+:H+ antiporter subunit F|nr:pH regulation protein F [Nanohaloarchaea archaeon H12]MBY6294091.1 pH regulation protein F [Nanohaloarchaea archaeon H01]NMI89081.1 pH regulation protein F [Candidatus Nanohaloarchaea archaeon]
MVVDIALSFSAVLTLLCSYRAIKGPDNEDRVVALDAISTNVIALAILYAISTQRKVFVNVSLMLAITGFTATAASAIYLRDGELIK